MNKHISEEKLIQQFQEIADFELTSEAVRRDLADIRKQLIDQGSAKSPASKNVWRTIMQNKVTRYASAAMIFFAVFVAMQFLPDAELNAAELLTKVSKNMLQFKYVKSVSQSYLPGQEEPASSVTGITDFKNRQSFLIYGKGYLHQLDYKKMIWSVYRPEDNTMVVKPLSSEWGDPESQIEEYIEKLSQEGLEVSQTEIMEDGIAVTVIEYDETLNNISHDPNAYMSKMMMGQTTVKTIRTKLVINRDDLYLSRGEMSYYDSKDNLIVTQKTTTEPIDSAPVDIYELGVPADVTIINKVPDERVKEVRGLIKQNQSRFLKDYVAIQLENRVNDDGSESLIEAMVIYSQGKKLRVDVYKAVKVSGLDEKYADAVKGLVEDSTTRLKPYVSDTFCTRAIRIYDGLWFHEFADCNGKVSLRAPQRRPDGDGYGDDDLDEFGWRVLWMYNDPEWMYEDEFSEENGLIGMEVTRQSQFGRLPERKVLYVDPSKDYLFRRYIEEEIVDAPWQIDKNWLDPVENKDRLEEQVRVYDVIEYDQTSEGQWYPKTITIKGYDDYPLRKNGYKNDFNRVSRIYLLEENPDLPDKLFDPEVLTIIEPQKK